MASDEEDGIQKRGKKGVTMSREPRAHCAVSSASLSPSPPHPLSHPRHTSADSAEKRSWRDPEGIPGV